jgi:hypothetical protein
MRRLEVRSTALGFLFSKGVISRHLERVTAKLVRIVRVIQSELSL